jgi:hypothetical protein
VIQNVVLGAFALITSAQRQTVRCRQKIFQKLFKKFSGEITHSSYHGFAVSAWLRNENLPAAPIMKTAC